MIRRPPKSTPFPNTTLFRARAARRDPGARPTDAGALLTEVQTVRDQLGAANVETAVLRQVPPRASIADATAIVPAVTARLDRKSTRLNSSHANISYAVFCLT